MMPFRLIACIRRGSPFAVAVPGLLAAACFAQELPLPPPSTPGEFRIQLPPLSKALNEQVVVIPAGRSWPRAFALSATGIWASASGGDDPASIALTYCQKKSPQPCRLYAVDDDVVWKESR